jgi:hypothetical protein
LIAKVKANMKKTEKEMLILVGDESDNTKLLRDITKLIDSEGFGLKREKEKDRKYQVFRKNVAKYYDSNKLLMDRGLQSLISLHINLSEFFANGLLILKEVDCITIKSRIPKITELSPPTTQANLEGLEKESDERLNELRVSISEYIREMQSKNSLTILGRPI